jgi:hypothetical protein
LNHRRTVTGSNHGTATDFFSRISCLVSGVAGVLSNDGK